MLLEKGMTRWNHETQFIYWHSIWSIYSSGWRRFRDLNRSLAIQLKRCVPRSEEVLVRFSVQKLLELSHSPISTSYLHELRKCVDTLRVVKRFRHLGRKILTFFQCFCDDTPISPINRKIFEYLITHNFDDITDTSALFGYATFPPTSDTSPHPSIFSQLVLTIDQLITYYTSLLYYDNTLCLYDP